ncbi:MAG: DUF2892 domain-containing protein [archaeon]|jgi:hypothetical protein
MNKNMSKLDMQVRSVIGLAIIGLGVYYQNWLGLIGLVPILVVAYGSCPLYTLINFSTIKKAKAEKTVAKVSTKATKKKSIKKAVKKKKK